MLRIMSEDREEVLQLVSESLQVLRVGLALSRCSSSLRQRIVSWSHRIGYIYLRGPSSDLLCVSKFGSTFGA